MSDEQELGCKDCWNFSEEMKCELEYLRGHLSCNKLISDGCGIKAVSPDNIMCMHHPKYLTYLNVTSPMIPDQLFWFKVNR